MPLLLELFKKHGNVLLNIDAFKIILTKLGVKPFGDFFLGRGYSVSFLEIAAKLIEGHGLGFFPQVRLGLLPQ